MSAVNENSRSFHKVGATPALLREAWEYVKKGEGVHYIRSPYYDNVLVSEVYPWKTLGDKSQGCLRVSFRKGDTPLRYVEFSSHVTGVGGTPIVREISF